MSHKLGFWAVFAFVTGSQIGSAVFILPATLAKYGTYSLAGWLISGCGAIALALIFASLCARFPQTGGPHVYVGQAFGRTASFFTGWTYWVISWVSTSILVITIVGYLVPLIGQQDPWVYFMLQTALVFGALLLNLRGVQAAGNVEFALFLFKMIPLFLMPLAAIFFFKSENLMVAPEVSSLGVSQILAQIVLLTMWGFIGLESATAPAGSVENPSRTIPLAVVLGTMSVAALYIFNSIGIMGLIPADVLSLSQAPYADAAQFMFGGNWYMLISLMAALVCIGSLNAWTLTSSQVALGLAQLKLFPSLFTQKNKADAPHWGLLVSSLGILPILFLTMNANMANQIKQVIDFSVMAFLFVYVACVLSFMVLMMRRVIQPTFLHAACGLLSLMFCSWVIYETPLMTLGVAALFVVSGLPMYFACVRPSA